MSSSPVNPNGSAAERDLRARLTQSTSSVQNAVCGRTRPEVALHPALLRWAANLVVVLTFVLSAANADVSIAGRVPLPHRHSAPVLNQRYEIVARGGILAPNPPLAIVYLAGPFPSPRQLQPPARIAQKDLEFVPALLAIQVGSRVEFPNEDDTYHNIFSYSSAKRFDLGRYRSDERPIPSVLFDTPGLVTLHCDIHEHMRALILVLDTPYFTVTDPDGNFHLAALPAGRHVLKAWLNSKTTLERPVALTDGAPVPVDFP